MWLMNDYEWYLCYHSFFAGCLAVTIIAAGKLISRRLEVAKSQPYPADTIILHHVGRGTHAPSPSPFAVKLETYLRMAKLPYKCDFKRPMSSKGKTPWITYNGEDVADSQFCIKFLNKKFDVDLNSSLSDTDKAVSHAFRKLMEDSLYWAMLMERWCYNPNYKCGLRLMIPAHNFVLHMVQRKFIINTARAQGIGRHSRAEVTSIAVNDIHAVSTFLGNKKFLMGDEPTEVDACLFGFVSQANLMADSEMANLLANLPNLSTYYTTMKSLYWPDWDDCNTDGGRKEATA